MYIIRRNALRRQTFFYDSKNNGQNRFRSIDFSPINAVFSLVTNNNWVSYAVNAQFKEKQMKTTIGAVISVSALIIAGLACSFSTANMSSLVMAKDKAGTQAASTFKAGETVYAVATISNSSGKTTTKFSVVADDAPDMKKGEVVKGTETSVDLPSSGTAVLTLPIPAGFKGGKFTVNAEMMDEKGEKKDSKSAAFTIEPSAAAPASSDTKKDEDDDQ